MKLIVVNGKMFPKKSLSEEIMVEKILSRKLLLRKTKRYVRCSVGVLNDVGGQGAFHA